MTGGETKTGGGQMNDHGVQRVEFKLKRNRIQEIIVVDDGSKDETYKIPLEKSKEEPRVKCLKLHRNRGKGS